MRVADEAKAVRLANDSAYERDASVWSGSRKRAQRLAASVEAGTVCINHCLVSYAAPVLPFGGVKSSGIGRVLGPDGVGRLSHATALLSDRAGLPRDLWWFPRRAGSARVGVALLGLRDAGVSACLSRASVRASGAAAASQESPGRAGRVPSVTTGRTRPRRRAVSDEEKSQRRDDILAAAKAVFARNGYQATTIADIAKQAGLAYGSVYWYFSSKDELFHSLMEAEENALRAHVAAALALLPAGPPTEGLFRTAVRTTFEFFEADRATVKLLFRDSYSLGDRFEKHLFGIYERFVADIEALITDAQDRGELIAAPPRMVAFSLAALIGQLAHRRLTTDDGVDAGVVADFVVSLVLDGLRPRGTGPSTRAPTVPARRT